MLGRIAIGSILIALFLGFQLLRPPAKKLPTADATAKPLVPATKTEPELLIAVPEKTVLYRAANGHFLTDAMVDNQTVRFIVDTGATSVALTMADAQRIGIPFDPAEFRVIGRGASGDVHGTMVKLHSLKVGDHEIRDVEAAIVAEGLDISLLGQSWLSRIGTVQISGDVMTLG